MESNTLVFPYGLDFAFWSRLHARVVPNPLTVQQLASAVVTATLGDYFVLLNVRRIAQEFRDCLLERGNWEEMEHVVVNGKKQDIIVSMSSAVCLLNKLMTSRGSVSASASAPVSIALPVKLNNSSKEVAPTSSFPVGHTGGGLPPAAGRGVGGLPEDRSTAALLNRVMPPFLQVIGIIKTVAIQYGSTPVKFQVPIHLSAGVQSRRLRVLVLPYSQKQSKSELQPHKWPAVKDSVVYVNDHALQVSWKRQWPERAASVAKSLLPLDITQFVSHGTAQQRLRIDIFNKEYTAHAAIAVAESFSVQQVVQRVLLHRLGMESEEQVENIFSCSGGDATLEVDEKTVYLWKQNNNRVEALYKRVMEEDDDASGGVPKEADDIVVEDPIVPVYCPLTRSALKIPIRGSRCRPHAQCVDLTNFLLNGQRAGYWNCVVCDAELREDDIEIDTFLWNHLHQTQEQSQNTNIWLQLSRRPKPLATLSPSKVSWTACVLYYWHSARDEGSSSPPDTGFVIDDVVEDSEADLAASAATKRYRAENTIKVSRREFVTSDCAEGTAENPIEL